LYFHLYVFLDNEEMVMAKTKGGKKIVPVKPHKRKKPGGTRKVVPVKPHRRSTPD
jgi:hypothetical protein